MDERHLLLLGLLMAQRQHGYSINEFIERNLGRVSGMKRATAYALLEKLERDGLVSMETVETVGNYPPRKVYAITEAGRETFFALMQQLLVDPEPSPSVGEIALMFVDWLERDRVTDLLQERAQRLRALADQLRAMPAHKDAPGVNLAVERKIALLHAEEAWLRQLIARLGSQPQKVECDDD
ncbi:MAG: hypothetical protein BAA04_00180 [Firmicutes bacterium ZCTH02-B6]|nr:MAG: hypothetical protein BAA04_00180 [Firmicutes bacterium ZCTH02-B6]